MMPNAAPHKNQIQYHSSRETSQQNFGRYNKEINWTHFSRWIDIGYWVCNIFEFGRRPWEIFWYFFADFWRELGCGV